MEEKHKYIVVESYELSKSGDTRYVVWDATDGREVDTANGYGYKTAESACAAWNYKNPWTVIKPPAEGKN